MGRLLLSRFFVPFVALLCITFFILRPSGVDGPMPPAFQQTGKGFDHSRWSKIIKNVRRENGTIDFEALKTQEKDLDLYLGSLRASCPRSTPHRFRDRNSRLAYYLNAYNAITLRLLAQHCPMESLSQPYWADGFYWRIGVLVGEARTTLTALETERIEPLVLRDPRVRFALFRGTVDAPLLQTVAFDASLLDEQLDAVTKIALDLPMFVHQSDQTVRLNPIFNWHKKEFGDFQTWFRSRGLEFGELVKFTIDEYDETVAQFEGSCSGIKH